VHKDVIDAFREQFVPAFKTILGKAGDPLDPSTTHGPLADSLQFGAVSKFIEDAKKMGIEPLSGGKAIGPKGYFVEPTIYVNVS